MKCSCRIVFALYCLLVCLACHNPAGVLGADDTKAELVADAGVSDASGFDGSTDAAMAVDSQVGDSTTRDGGESLKVFDLPTENFLEQDVSPIKVFDMDKDGYLDLVGVRGEHKGLHSTENAVEVFVAYGAEVSPYEAANWQVVDRIEGFQTATHMRGVGDGVIAVDDVNDDGQLDIVSATTIALGQGGRNYQVTRFTDRFWGVLNPVVIATWPEGKVIIRGGDKAELQKCALDGNCTKFLES